MPRTRPAYRSESSYALAAPLSFVIVGRIEIKGSKRSQDSPLLVKLGIIFPKNGPPHPLFSHSLPSPFSSFPLGRFYQICLNDFFLSLFTTLLTSFFYQIVSNL